MGKPNIEDDDRYEFKGVKIAHELMVDILGALIPGALFLFCTIVCIVFPLICYATPNNNFGFLMKDGDWFWIVAFLSFLILSYVIGLIFYRADIKVPDRRDIRREQKKKLKALLNKMPKTDINAAYNYVAELLINEIEPLRKCLSVYLSEHPKEGNSTYNSEFINSCNVCIKELSVSKKDNCIQGGNTASLQKSLLKVLFPESDFTKTNTSSKKNNKKVKNLFSEAGYIPNSVQKVIRQATKILPKVRFRLIVHQFKACKAKKICLNRLIICYMILHMQNESGCATEDRCDFPYMSYYKYLLKRELKDLLKYVKWCTPATRTKNQLNQYKIELQLHVPNAFSIITKNESHIRMASSSWHVARVVVLMSGIMAGIMLCLAVCGAISYDNDIEKLNKTEQQRGEKIVVNYHEGSKHQIEVIPKGETKNHNLGSSQKTLNSECEFVNFINTSIPFLFKTDLANKYLAVLFPIFTLLLGCYILSRVPKFIHYQRLREIYYTMSIYKLWEDAKCHRDERYKQNLAIRRAEVGMPPMPSDNMPPNMNSF